MKKDLKRLCKVLIAMLIISTFILTNGCTPATKQNDTGTPGSNPGADSGSSSSSGTADAVGIPELVVCVGPEPDTIDPALNTSVDGATLIIHAFEGLYSLDKNGIPIPGQAESVDISDDGKVYTFHLRDGLKWSDGSPITANDFVYSWSRAVSPDTAADYEYMFDVISGYDSGNLDMRAIDERTFEVRLIARTPYFLELTAFPVFYPVQEGTVTTNGDAWATKVATYTGNGPYRLTEWIPGSYMLYVKNPDYWNFEALGPEKIKFVLMDDDNAILAGYNSGGLSFIDTVPNDEIPALRGRDDFYIIGQLGTYYISFNTQSPPLDNPRFRQALTLAIDREFITEHIGLAGQIPAGAFVAEGISDATPGSSFRNVGGNYYDPTSSGYAANLAKAKSIIDELYPDGNVPTIEYIFNVGTGHQLIAEALQEMWASIGVKSTLEVQEWAVFLNTRKNGGYQVARNGWLNDYNDPIGMLDMWITGGGNNDAQWSNAEYDLLISNAKATSDQAERMRYLHQAEDIIFNEWMLSPIYYYVDLFMINSGINGFYASPMGFKFFMYTYF